MSKHPIQWPRHGGEIERTDKEARVLGLTTRAGAEETPELCFPRSSALRRLPLEDAEAPEIALSVEEIFDRCCTVASDQLVFQIRDADVEAETFHLVAREVGAEATAFESSPEDALFAGVTQPGEREVGPLRAELVQEPSDALGTSDSHN
jgi:hypothetical protein